MPCTHHKLGYTSSNSKTQQGRVLWWQCRRQWFARGPRSFRVRWNWDHSCYLRKGKLSCCDFLNLWHKDVQARSSAQRKAAFMAIQDRCKVPPVQLLLDMKVQWSSTFIMLTRAESCHEVSMCFLLRQDPYWYAFNRQSTNLFWNWDSRRATQRSVTR